MKSLILAKITFIEQKKRESKTQIFWIMNEKKTDAQQKEHNRND